MSFARVAACLSLFVLAGCTSPPEVKYYSLRSSEPITAKQASAGAPAVLLDRFVVDDAYGDERIAYRAGAHEVGYDPYSRWAGAPGPQVEDAVRDLLRASGLFSAVRQPAPIGTGRTGYDYVVTGRVARLEEVDADDDHWNAALELELFLLDGKTRDVLYSKRFAETAPAAKRNPREVVAALSRMLEKAVKEFADGARPCLAARSAR
ncbi:membrane integrity-associated transporter subunit PqiC [bacterium]|nr:membrane integrity-associated transporter subunit PqiC [bacterium]